MPAVFLSYSRKDQAFVRRLHETLEQSGRNTWVDWSDIPPTAEFMREINDGIASADTFVFIISPDSVASKVCSEEIGFAVAFKKRLIPIVYRDVSADQVHSALSSHNWIYCRESDDFDAAFRQLTEAIDTDLSLARLHTRLLMRARDWESKNRHPSLVLQGKDLDDAEHWLVESTGKRPAPLPLHAQFIAASRKVARNRYRALLYTSVIALVFFILVSFFLQLSIQNTVARNEAIKTQAGIETQVMQTAQWAMQQLTVDANTMTALAPGVGR